MELEEPLSSGGWHPGCLPSFSQEPQAQRQGSSFPVWQLVVWGLLRLGYHSPLLMALIQPIWRAGLWPSVTRYGYMGQVSPCASLPLLPTLGCRAAGLCLLPTALSSGRLSAPQGSPALAEPLSPALNMA